MNIDYIFKIVVLGDSGVGKTSNEIEYAIKKKILLIYLCH